MEYLKRRHSRLILCGFLIFSLTVIAFPRIDLAISALFFDGVSFPRDQWWQTLAHDALNWFLCATLGAVLAVYVFNRLTKRTLGGIDGWRVAYLFLVLAIGGGLIVNVALKDNFGRARPRDVVEFGGLKQFTPAFVSSRECNTNCSFSSGDAAGGFFSLALAMALCRRRVAFVAALAVGAVVSLGRLSSGAHFFSDVGVSFFVMWIVADVLHFYMVATRAERAGVPVKRPALEPAV
ncbi:MAG TPA: phosphatase PAP2 family protein [Steroidobacteraceae bacterium]|nr:phosphatase PAP2 family protein [Steroidobacteraceae bacterium]